MAQPSKKVIDKYRTRVESLKGKFERSLKIIFHSWQIKVFKEFKSQVARGASVYILSPDLKKDLTALLISHYRAVAEAFVPGLDFPEIKQEEEEDDDDNIVFDWMLPGIFADIIRGINAQIDLNLPLHQQSIINTTEFFGTQAITLARIEGGKSSVIMANKMAGRETTVSITETDWIAEASMGTAVAVTTPRIAIADEQQLREIQKISPNVTLKELDVEKVFATPIFLEATRRTLSLPRKMWLTVGDKKVRPSHRLAFGQIRALTQPFKLPGGLLMFPADSSLGVSFKEIVNCRCWAMYF